MKESESNEKKDLLGNFSFPIVKNVLAHTLADKIKSAHPMTQLEAAKGRPIKPYPQKYDTFASASDLKNYILDVLHHNKKLNVGWLQIETSHTLPINLRDDVYYTGVSIVSITCHRPPESPFDDIIFGETICQLKPGDPLVAEAHMIIDSLKRVK